MIPKKIHYFWFGGASKNELLLKCLASWQQHLPDYQIIEWNETNYDVSKSPFTKKAFSEQRWAFLSDYARLDILNQYGGVYLDTDMEVLKPLDALLYTGVFIGMESDTHVNGSIIGSIPNHWLVQEILSEYNELNKYKTIPVIMTEVLSWHTTLTNTLTQYKDVTVYPTEYFYPFGFGETFGQECITEHTHAIHWWNHSWSSKKARILKKLGLLNLAIKIKNILH